MLSVRIDGREVELTPASLARLVFDGRVDRHSPSKTPGTTAERTLEQCLEPPHCEALSDELLCRLRSMYASQTPAVDIHVLCEQVERLCQWRWTSPHVASRFFWAAAWLNDVMDRLETAAEFYNAFLQTPCREGHLRLLAYNNRAVLRIRLGRLEGVLDLLRAAVPDSAAQANDERSGMNSAAADLPFAGLPAACFNLLNLINVSLGSGHLTQVVDEELADFFSQLPEELRTAWLGREIPEAGDGQAEGPDLTILRDSTHRRLNRLTTRLAACASELPAGESTSTTGRLSSAVSQLVLWESRSDGDGLAAEADRSMQGAYGHCAEAASLLLSEDIPSSLTRIESPLVRAEQSVREDLANLEGRLILGQYDLVKSRLQVQRRILSSLSRRGRLAGLIARIDAQLERVDYVQSQSEQLDLQRTCAGLISGVEQFGRLIDLCRAERDYDDLVGRIRCVRSGLEPQTSNEVSVLLDELTARLDRHLRRLRRLEIRRTIRSPWRFLRRNWPADWASPVPESVYQALAQCRLSDPQCCVEDWPALKDRLDSHQGQYHLHRVFALLQAGQVSWDSVDEDLMKALVLKPDVWWTAAPLFGLFGPSDEHDPRESAASVQIAMHASASLLFDGTPQGSHGPQGTGHDGPMHRAGELLGRVFGRMEGPADRCVELWRCVAATLAPVLEREDLAAIAQVRTLAERCLDCWPIAMVGLPGRADPRNPVRVFLESCEKTRRLIEARQQLNASPVLWQEAKTCYSDLLRLGLDTRDQLRRAATGFYLAACHEEDAPHVQRHVLAGLEAWVDNGPRENACLVREHDVVQEIMRLRAEISAR